MSQSQRVFSSGAERSSKMQSQTMFCKHSNTCAMDRMEVHPSVMKTLLVEEETNPNGPIKQDTDWLQ